MTCRYSAEGGHRRSKGVVPFRCAIEDQCTPRQVHYDRSLLAAKSPKIRKVTQIAKNIKKRTFAISAAPAAMPPKPNRAATIEMTKKMAAQRSIGVLYKQVGDCSISVERDPMSSCDSGPHRIMHDKNSRQPREGFIRTTRSDRLNAVGAL